MKLNFRFNIVIDAHCIDRTSLMSFERPSIVAKFDDDHAQSSSGYLNYLLHQK